VGIEAQRTNNKGPNAAGIIHVDRV
jgi:hypothetical protein